MQKNSQFIFVVILLSMLCSCTGSNINSETSVPETNTTPKDLEVLPSSPQANSEKPAVPSPPRSQIPEQSPPSEPSKNLQTPSPSPKTSSPQTSVKTGSPIPKLSPEKEKQVGQITKEIKQKAEFVTQNSGMTTLNRLLIAQQAMWLISGSFSQDFKALEPNLPAETDEYQFKITQGNQSEAIMVAIAKSETLPSFTGKTVAVPAGIPKSGLCQSKLPSKTAPTPPKIDQNQVQCGNDGVEVEEVQP